MIQKIEKEIRTNCFVPFRDDRNNCSLFASFFFAGNDCRKGRNMQWKEEELKSHCHLKAHFATALTKLGKVEDEIK